MSRGRHAATAALWLALAIAHTWPVARIPDTWSRVDNGDYSLNAWAMAWVAHQAPRDPVHLFDANIFYPEPRTLAFSEHLVPQALLAAPVRWAGGSAVLAYNLVMIAGFALSGWAMTWLVTRWTGHWTAGLVAGSVHAFNAHTMTRLVHQQALHVYYLPLALASLDALFERRRCRDAWTAGIAAALQGLTSGYWLVFTIVAMGAGSVSRVAEWWHPAETGGHARCRRPVWLLVLAAVIGAAIVTPFTLPYWQAKQQQGLVRGLDEVARYSASWVDYLSSASRLHFMSPLRAAYLAEPGHDSLFPGVLPSLLAAVALVSGIGWRDRRARMLTAIGLAGLLLSLGPATAPYRWMYYHLPLLQGIRGASRFGILVIVAIAGLAGVATAWIDRRLAARGTDRRLRVALAVALVAAVNAEAFRAPLGYKPFQGISPVYRIVARLPDPVVLAEFPMYQPRDFFKNADYMLASTVHWKPLVNGYSGFMPASYRRLAEAMRVFPDPPTTDLLRKTGVTHVAIHRNLLGGRRDLLIRTMLQSTEFELVAGDEQVWLFRLRPR